MNQIKVGNIYTLTKCKHSFNNGKVVRVESKREDGFYRAVLVKKSKDEINNFIVSPKNLIKR